MTTEHDGSRDRFEASGKSGSLRGAAGTSRLRLDKYREEAAEQLAWFEQARGFLGGRIQMLRFVLNIRALPPTQQQASVAGLKPDSRGMVEAILAQIARTPALVQRIQMAIDRFDRAAALARSLAAFLGGARGEGPDALQFALDHDLAKIRGLFYGLTTLDTFFKDEPVLSQVFPPINREKTATKTGGPAPAQAKATVPLVPPSPHRSKLTLPNPPPRAPATAPLEAAPREPAAPPSPVPRPAPPVAGGFLADLIARCKQVIEESASSS